MVPPWQHDKPVATRRKLAKLDEHRRFLLKNAFASAWQRTRGLNILDIASSAERDFLEEERNRRVIIRRVSLTNEIGQHFPNTRLLKRQAFVREKFSDFPNKVDGVVCELRKRAQEILLDCPVAIRSDLQFVLRSKSPVRDELNAAFVQLAASIKREYEVEAGLADFAPICVNDAWEHCKTKLLSLLDELERSLLHCGAAEKTRRGRPPSPRVIRRCFIIYKLYVNNPCNRATLLKRAKESDEIKRHLLEDDLKPDAIRYAMKMGRQKRWKRETTLAEVGRQLGIDLS